MNFRSALAAVTAPLSWRAVLVLMAALAVASGMTSLLCFVPPMILRPIWFAAS